MHPVHERNILSLLVRSRSKPHVLLDGILKILFTQLSFTLEFGQAGTVKIQVIGRPNLSISLSFRRTET